MISNKWSAALILALAAISGMGAVSVCGDGNPNSYVLDYELDYLPAPRFVPNWTPDGQYIVFGRYVIDVDGTSLSSMVPESLEGGSLDYQYSSDVSSVEPRVAYMTLRHGDGVLTKVHSWDIVTSSIGGTDYKRLTSEESFESNPVWSPDGMQIAFYSDRDGSNDAPFSLFIMDNDGSTVRNLTPGMKIVQSELPVWSPSGDRIAFWVDVPSSREGRSYDWAMHVVNSDGSGLKRISRAASHLAWSPDGSYLAFMINDPFENEVETPTVAIAELGGSSEVRQIPIQPRPEISGEHIVDARALVWSQDGSKLKFVTCHVIPLADDSRLQSVRAYSLNADGESQPKIIARWSDFPVCPYLALSITAVSSYSGYEIAWSPDHSRIAVLAFSRTGGVGRHPLFHSLFVLSADGTGFKHLVVEADDGSLIAANPSQ